jgi:hypothetical protein
MVLHLQYRARLLPTLAVVAVAVARYLFQRQVQVALVAVVQAEVLVRHGLALLAQPIWVVVVVLVLTTEPLGNRVRLEVLVL